MNSSYVNNINEFNNTQIDEIKQEITETLTLMKQFYDVSIVKFVDYNALYTQQIISCDDPYKADSELNSLAQTCTQEKLYIIEDTLFDPLTKGRCQQVRFYSQYPIYNLDNSLIGVLIIADISPKTLIGSQKEQFVSFAQLLQTQLNKHFTPTKAIKPSETKSLNRFVHLFSLAPVAFLIALVICSFSALLLYTLDKKDKKSAYAIQTQQLRQTLFDALERFDNQALYITQKDKIVAGFLKSQQSYTQQQLSDLVKTQVSSSLTYKGFVVFDNDYKQLAIWSKNNFDLAAYGFTNWLNAFSMRANKQSVEVFTVADTAFLISEINMGNSAIYTLTAFDLSKFLNAIIGKLNTQNYNLFISTPQFILGSRGELNVKTIPNSISAASSRFPATWRLHVQPIKPITPANVSRFDLFKLALISLAIFAFVYYFLRLPRRLHDEIKQKNTLILNRESLFSSSLDALPHGFAIFNSNEFPVITNQAFNELFSHVIQNNKQLSYSQIMSISQQNNIITHYQEHNKLANEHSQLIDIGFSDGRWITVVQRHTDFGGFVCYFRDETQAHQKELLLAQVVEKSKQANQLKDKFVARLAMQLKAPLSSLQSIVELNYKNSKANFSSELENACTQLSCVVQQLVNINKTDTGKLKLKMSAINLADLLKNTADILNKDSDDKNIIINNNVPIDKGISSDEKLIMQLIIQLASELIESTHQGKLSLNSELINEQGKHYLSLGFSINNLANQGSFYSQLQMVCKQQPFESDINFDATLELRFFLSIFKMLGGKNITVHERGKTTSINLSLLVNTVELLPVSANKQEPITVTTTHTEFNNTKSLLLVDDEPLVEMVIKAMLKDENVAIDYASNAIEAMLMVSQNNYDIILMDIVMPELSGTDAMLKIKKHNAGKQTKIIAHTSDSDTNSNAKYVELGFDDMLEKPVKQQVLINKIKHLLS